MMMAEAELSVRGNADARGDTNDDWPLFLSLPSPLPVRYILALQYFRSGWIRGLERDALMDRLATKWR